MHNYFPNHPRLRNFVCQLCKPEHRDHFFENENGLKIHLRLVHERGITGFEKKKATARKSTAANPVFRHKCDECDKTFELETYLNNHMYNEHRKNDEE